MPLGTDGMGRSDTREALRAHFEVDNAHIVVATPGHSLDVLQNPTVRTILERGMLWASRTASDS